MVRGHAKAQAQAAAQKKSAGGKGTGKSSLGAPREACLKQFKCPICLTGCAVSVSCDEKEYVGQVGDADF